ncbi:hypothetical protein MIMGU_mgv11b014174mg [Erythranthe guttata]|uniref:Uncharacterized protein n=1 Tax=Erythranthe guttata TaxID=4155 RepID=A0A022RUZ9_ERYGU|nr:hypothetical protein MIMGU_mgv11b014174mg [Erythranthe guttata]
MLNFMKSQKKKINIKKRIVIENRNKGSPQPSRLPLGFEKGENIALSNGTLNISHNKPILVVHKFDSHLSHLSPRPRSPDNLNHNSMLYLRIHSAKPTRFSTG